MELKEYPYDFWYMERYLPTPRHKKYRLHSVKSHSTFKLRVAEGGDDFPVACVFHTGRNGEATYRHHDGHFWSKVPYKAKPEDIYRIAANMDRNYNSPPIGSEVDVANGWDEGKSVIINDESKKVMQRVQDSADEYIFCNDALWSKCAEPHYKEHISAYGAFSADGMLAPDVSPNVPDADQMDPQAYSVKDVEAMKKRFKRLADKCGSDSRFEIDEVDILMPDVFHFGENAEEVILEKGYNLLPFSTSMEFQDMRKDNKPTAFETYLKEHIGEKIVKLMKKAGDPLYRANGEYAKLALAEILEEAAAALNKKHQV